GPEVGLTAFVTISASLITICFAGFSATPVNSLPDEFATESCIFFVKRFANNEVKLPSSKTATGTRLLFGVPSYSERKSEEFFMLFKLTEAGELNTRLFVSLASKI